MLGSNILDVVIGLAFVYLIFSLTCSVIMEFIARLLNMRGATLKQAIRQMVYGALEGRAWIGIEAKPSNKQPDAQSTSADNARTVDDFYTHALIKPLFTTAYHWWMRSPSYLEPRTFALVLVDKILDYDKPRQKQAQTESASVSSVEIDKTTPAETIKDLLDRLPQDSPLTKKLQRVLAQGDLPTAEELDFEMRTTMKDLETTLKLLTGFNPELNKALLSIMTAAKAQSSNWEEAYDNTLAEIEKWFESTMERVTGWYGRKARAVTFVIAVLITLAFNVDSLAIARSLYTNTAQREALVGAAAAYIQQAQVASSSGATDASAGSAQLSGDAGVRAADAGEPSLDDLGTTGDSTGNVQPSGAHDGQVPEQSLGVLLEIIEGLDIPIGWVVPNQAACTGLNKFLCTPLIMQFVDETVKPDPSQIYPIGADQWPDKLAGLALTVLMLSLGAPFWFDMLNRLVDLRASGAKPEAVDKKS